MVLEELVQTRDLAVMGMLKSLGIEKGKPFNPDPATRTLLKAAAEEAQAFFLDKMTNYSNLWWPDLHWSTLDASGSNTGWTFQTSEMLDVDERGRFNFAAFGLPKKAGTTGEASFYLITYRDKNGVPLSGENTYVLRIPPDVPAKQYWSAIAYDVQTSTFVCNAPVITLDSYSRGLKKNADGSIDLYFGPKAPPGQESNWIDTAPKRGWFVGFRLYGPDKPLFDRTWKLPDMKQTAPAGQVDIAA
jgi:hypothetical protein